MASSYCEVLSLEEPSASSDLVLIVEGRNFYVHKAVLGLYSPVFERMFFSKSVEKVGTRIKLPGKEYYPFLEFLRQMYPVSSLEPISGEMLEGVMKLADEYQVGHIFQKCKIEIESYLMLPKEKHRTDQTLRYLWMCHLYEPISILRQSLVELAAKQTTDQLQRCWVSQFVPAAAMKDVALRRSKNLEEQLDYERMKKIIQSRNASKH